jgi:hypothetical protein
MSFGDTFKSPRSTSVAYRSGVAFDPPAIASAANVTLTSNKIAILIKCGELAPLCGIAS